MSEQLLEDFKRIDSAFEEAIIECYEKYIEQTKDNNSAAFMFLSALGYYINELKECIPNLYEQYMEYFIGNHPEIKDYIEPSLKALAERDRPAKGWHIDGVCQDGTCEDD